MRLCSHRADDSLCSENPDQPFEVVSQHMQARLSAHAGECLGQEVCRSHPRFERAEGVFDGLPTQSGGLRCAVQALLHRLEYVLVLPTGDSPILAAGASRFDGTLRAGGGPILVEC
jgi:hypothetical protein